MAKRRSGSSVRGEHRAGSVPHTSDAKIDFSDISERSARQLSSARRVGRPSTGRAKQLIAIRISPELLAQLKRIADREGRPYQSLMHQILEQAVKRHAA